MIITLGCILFLTILGDLFLRYMRKKQRQIDKKIKEYNESVAS